MHQSREIHWKCTVYLQFSMYLPRLVQSFVYVKNDTMYDSITLSTIYIAIPFICVFLLFNRILINIHFLLNLLIYFALKVPFPHLKVQPMLHIAVSHTMHCINTQNCLMQRLFQATAFYRSVVSFMQLSGQRGKSETHFHTCCTISK